MGRDTGCRTSRCLQLLAWIARKDEIIPAWPSSGSLTGSG